MSNTLQTIIGVYENIDKNIIIREYNLKGIPNISVQDDDIYIGGIDDQTLIDYMDKYKDNTSQMIAILQYLKNKEEWEKYKNDTSIVSNEEYIENQNALKNMRFGSVSDLIEYMFFEGESMTAADNSCGAIATYNAIHSLGDMPEGVDFPEILRDYSLYGLVFDGALGTSPTTIQEYFNDHNYETYILVDGGINNNTLQRMQENYDTYILTAYNHRDNIASGVHTINISYNNGKYILHNSINSTILEYDSLAEAVNGFNDGTSEPVSVIGIREE